MRQFAEENRRLVQMPGRIAPPNQRLATAAAGLKPLKPGLLRAAAAPPPCINTSRLQCPLDNRDTPPRLARLHQGFSEASDHAACPASGSSGVVVGSMWPLCFWAKKKAGGTHGGFPSPGLLHPVSPWSAHRHSTYSAR